MLNGKYYFRNVIYNISANVFAFVYGNITFNGSGSYTISGAVEGDTSSGSLGPYSPPPGTYTLSASGFGYLSNLLLGGSIYGLYSNGVLVGSSTESGYNDLFIAVPVGSQGLSTLQGTYTMAYIDPLGSITNGLPFDAQLQMNPNGAGTIGAVNISAYATTSSATTQSISGIKYITSNNAFVLTFPTCNCNNLLQGQEYLYSSPDGNFVFGGSPNSFDMFVGVRNGSSGSNFGGFYYEGGIIEDLSQLANNAVGLGTFYGSFDAFNGTILGHQRLLFNSTVEGLVYVDSYQGSSGTYNDTPSAKQFVGGNGGTLRIGLGIGPDIGISLAVQAPSFSGSGVYINPIGVVNAASTAPFTAGVSRGELITLFGSNLGPSTPAIASTIPFPTSLGGVKVMINNIPAPIYSVSSSQVSVIVPYEIQESAGSVAQIQVINNGQSSNTVTEFVNLTTPGAFTNPVGGLGYAAAEHAGGALVTPSNPAQIGETIQVFVTGLGDVFPSIADGAAGVVSATTSSNPITADINGTSAMITYAGLAPQLAGLYQVNLQIPTGLTAGDNVLDISGPDSYSSEALITIGSSGAAQPQAEPARRSRRIGGKAQPFHPPAHALIER